MEHVGRLVGAEERLHVLLFADAGHDGVGLDVGPLVVHHQANVVLRRLGLVDEHQFAWLIDGYLAHHLAADAASRAGNHDALAAQLLAHRLQVNLYLVAWQQVFNADFLQLGRFGGQGAVGIQFFGFLRHEDADASLYHLVLEFLVVAEVGKPEGRNDECFNLHLFHPFHQVVVHHIHFAAQEVVAHHLFLNGGEAFQLEVSGLLGAYVLGQGYAVAFHAEDEGPHGALRGEGDFVESLHHDAQNPQQHRSHGKCCHNLR